MLFFLNILGYESADMQYISPNKKIKPILRNGKNKMSLPTNKLAKEKENTSFLSPQNKLPYFKSMNQHYTETLCFVLCKFDACVPKELEPGIIEFSSPHEFNINSNESVNIPLDLMILLPVNTYANFILDPYFVNMGLSIVNSLHMESNTGTVTLIIKNHTNETKTIRKHCPLALITVVPKYTKSIFCIESFDLTKNTRDLNRLYEVCKAKENENLFRFTL